MRPLGVKIRAVVFFVTVVIHRISDLLVCRLVFVYRVSWGVDI